MSREKSKREMRNVPITVRLNEEEHQKLKQCAAACGVYRFGQGITGASGDDR